VLSAVSFTLPDHVEHLTLTGAAAINGAGNALANLIRGNAAANVLTGGAGNDTLAGLGGNDRLNGGLGADRMEGGPGNDTYIVDNRGDLVVERAGQGIDQVLSAVSFTLPAHVENLTLTGAAAISGAGNALANVILGNAAANVLTGGAGNDTLAGLGGNDRLDGGLGADRMEGGPGNDTYVVDNRGDLVVERAGQGIDLVLSAVSFTLPAHVENLSLIGAAAIDGAGNALANVIRGTAATNILSGGAGNDQLFGGGGDDILIGGLGRDVLNGGPGVDTFRFTRAADSGVGALSDLIADFEARDLIDLAAIDACQIGAAQQDFAFIGTDPFTGTSGELRAVAGLVAADLDGDGIADFEILIATMLTPLEDNFIL
jgi:trimeric autotransporter adhesin